MQRFKEGDLVYRRTWDDETCDWALVKGETWVFLGGWEDDLDRSFGEFLSPHGGIVKTPIGYFVDEDEARIMKNLRNHFI